MSDVETKKKSVSPEKAVSRESSRDRVRKRRSRSRERRRRSYSRSRSPLPFRGGQFRGGRNNRFNRRSPDRFRGRGRFNRSRSRSNNRFENRGRRFNNNRRSRSASRSPSNTNANYMQQQQVPAAPIYSDAYGNAYGGFGQQFNAYDFQGQNYAPPAPAFGGIACPAPPGLSEGWVPPPVIQQEESEEDRLKREAAVAEEKQRQREGLKKQRDQYILRSEKMKREMKELKQQKSDLVAGHGKRSPSPKTNGFIKENEKLQAQIKTKLSEILNVIDMLTNIIGKDEEEPKKKSGKKTKKSDSDSSPERIKEELLESMKRKKKEAEEKKQKFNYIVYDPELHWCKWCQVFPKTAKEYLVHLHTKEHAEKSSKNSAPWRENFQKTNEVPIHPDAPTKRAPIRGLQFFEPATAWYCKLCEIFMGDTFCASLHLKSELHTSKYDKLLEKEPKFEEKWLEARKKALEASEPNGKSAVDKKDDKKLKKKKNKRDKKKNRDKKKKRGSSSSSSGSDDSDSSSESESGSKKPSNSDSKNSIRVAMRKLLAKTSENDERVGKWTMVSANASKPVPPPAPSISQSAAQEKKKDEQILGQWSKVEPVISKEDKQLLDNLKSRLKNKAEEPEKERDRRDRSRSRERSRNYRSRRSHSRSRRSRSRSRRSRSRSCSRSRGRYSRRSRSRSRRVERPIVTFPSEPRLPPSREDKKINPPRTYVVNKKEESNNGAKKVMPIIGKMPVFKKQLSDKKSEEQEVKDEQVEPVAEQVEEKKPRDTTWDDYMPDPLQYSALMGAPPPPPQFEVPEPEQCVPPGLDPDFDSEFIPKPISDAPIARKGPLPQDFQDTLDLLYDGDKPKPVVIEQKQIVPEPQPIEPPPIVMSEVDGPQMMTAEELSQHALLYGGFYAHNADGTNPMEKVKEKKAEVVVVEEPRKEAAANGSSEKVEDAEDETKQMEMDDLAMLGIDVNDVGSGFW